MGGRTGDVPKLLAQGGTDSIIIQKKQTHQLNTSTPMAGALMKKR
jgi:hypothetical protein